MLDSRDNLQTFNTINLEFVYTMYKDGEDILDFVKYILADYPVDVIFSFSEYFFSIFPIMQVFDYYVVHDINTEEDYVILDFEE